jgi:nitrogen-specific signal transduction histidine kinase
MSSRYILNNSIDLLYVVSDTSGNILSSNDLFKEYTSHIKADKVGDVMADDTDLDSYIEAVNKAKGLKPVPIRFYAKTKQKTGSLKWNLWNVYHIMNSLHFVGVPLIDVTSITSHEYERQKKLLDDFRFMLSHELRQPLSSVAGLVKLMIDNDNVEDNTELLQMVKDSVDKLDHSIHLLVNKAAREL